MVAHHNSEEIAAQQHQWHANMVEPTLQQFPERLPEFTTLSGIPLQRLYTPLDFDLNAYLEQLNFPGSSRLRAVCIRRCIVGGCGPCGSTPALGRQRPRTSAINFSSNAVKGLERGV